MTIKSKDCAAAYYSKCRKGVSDGCHMAMMWITSLHLPEMFSTTICLHLETSVLSKVGVNSEAAAVVQRRQSSSPLSVWLYEAWEPWSIKATVALMSGSQMLFTGLLRSALHWDRKECFCNVCSVHVITSCIQPPLKIKMQDAISAFMQSEKWCGLLQQWKPVLCLLYPQRACDVTICLFWINHGQKSTLNKRFYHETRCMLPSDRRVEYFMIKRAIILHRSRPRLRLKGGGLR